MSTVTPHPPGTFCWPELGTTDLDGAAKFYSSLLGLKAHDASPAPDMKYYILQKNGGDAAALYQLGPQQAGMPAAWTIYVAVDSVAESTKKCESLGGNVFMGNIDVMDLGRLSVLQDPTGGVFAIWETKTHKGATAMGTPGTFCWAELWTRDTAAAQKFYTQMFPWRAKSDSNAAMQYTEWLRGETPIGGMMDINNMGPAGANVPAHWLLYFMVENCDATFQKATQLGGKPIMPPMDIPGVGRFSVLMDPQSAVFAVIQLSPMHGK